MLFGRRKPGYTTTVDSSVDPEQAVLDLQKAELAAKKKPKAEVFDINAASETARRLKETGSSFDGSAAKTGEDVIAAVERVQRESPELQLHSFVTVVDATKARIYMKNFGEFFNNQVEHASAILLSRTQSMDEGKLNAAVNLLRAKNAKAAILTTPWDQLTGAQIVSAMEGGHSLAEELMEEIGRTHSDEDEHEHHHHHHDHDHEHHHDHEEHEHHHEHEHEHHHDHGDECDACCACGHDHHHHHHDGHDADEIFTSWGRETPRKYSREELQDILSSLAMGQDYGYILRAKGMVPCEDGQTWLHFDLVPEEFQIREGAADYTGRLCVIGSDLKEDQLEKLFLLA